MTASPPEPVDLERLRELIARYHIDSVSIGGGEALEGFTVLDAGSYQFRLVERRSAEADFVRAVPALLDELERLRAVRDAAKEHLAATEDEADKQEPPMRVVVRRAKARTALRELLERPKP